MVINRYAKLKDESVKSVTKNYFLEQFLIILFSILFSLPLYFYKNIYAIVISILFITALLVKLLLINKVSLLLYSLSTILNLLFLSLLSKEIFDNINYELVSVYIVSTILGMIVFTSPAGLGVRESIFIFLMQGSIDSIYLLNFIVISRLIYFYFGHIYFDNGKFNF